MAMAMAMQREDIRCLHSSEPPSHTGGAYRFTVDPRIISTHADVALLRVLHPNNELHHSIKSYEYFVYTARPRPGASSLRLLPNPRVSPFCNKEVIIVRCSSGTRYVIVGLVPTINHPMDFMLWRFDSDIGHWKSTVVSIDEPVERDRLLPIPDPANEVLFHCTTKLDRMDDKGLVISVDLMSKTLQGVAELDERKNSFFKRYYNTSEISKYLVNGTGLFYDCVP
uniref:DUF1618 domain-containing protein n=1 Tax=Oryza punctata TaxID=4537 RepID=A0A0E0LJX9_ORYPU